MQLYSRRPRHGRVRRGARIVAVAAALVGGACAAPAAQAATTYQELFRPQFHFTPAQNWMNDPNGLVYDNGEYHLFYQYNPFGNTWGNMSWGHAVSKDLVHWTQLPVAIPAEGDELIFSGSAVVDKDNTAGFGAGAMVAIYTSARPNSQAQSLAYSLDHGRTWTKYAGNPVLDIGSAEFRDPKVFWYAAGHKWVMAVSKAQEHKIALYSSTNLKTWTHMSDFGPANDTNGAWECPDLFPLQLDGGQTKWVLVVNINPGGIAGGSGTQYFVGDFDGTTFTAENRRMPTPLRRATSSRTSKAPATAAGRLPAGLRVRARARQRCPPQDASGVHRQRPGQLLPQGDRHRHADLAGLHASARLRQLPGRRRQPPAHDPLGRRHAPPGDVLATSRPPDYGRLDGHRHLRRHRPAHRTAGRHEGDQLVNTFFGHRLRHDPGTIISPDFTITATT